MMRTGIFVGSFNPFTIGHDSIVTRALPLFDRLVIGVVGDQVHKPDMPSAEERMAAIRDLYRDEPRIEVKPYYRSSPIMVWLSTLPVQKTPISS